MRWEGYNSYLGNRSDSAMLDPNLFLHIDALSRMLIILRPLSSLNSRFMDNLHITITFAVAAAVNRNLVGGRGVFGRERE